MTKYVFTYHAGPDDHGMPESEEEQAKLMAVWGAWFETIGANLVDGGNPFAQARTVNTDGSVTDGGGVNPATGYGIINAADLDAAVAVAKGCPVLANGGNVEVSEAIDM